MRVRVTGFDIANPWSVTALAAAAQGPSSFVVAVSGHVIVAGNARLSAFVDGGAEFVVDEYEVDREWQATWSHLCTAFAAAAAMGPREFPQSWGSD
jgi:poly(3-hydroxyalkanoate) synthetase